MILIPITLLISILVGLRVGFAEDLAFSHHHYSECLADAKIIDPRCFKSLKYPEDYASIKLLVQVCDTSFPLPHIAQDVSKYTADSSLVYKQIPDLSPKEIVEGGIFPLIAAQYYKTPKNFEKAGKAGARPAHEMVKEGFKSTDAAIELKWRFSFFPFYDSLDSLKIGAPYSRSWEQIGRWSLGGLRAVIVEAIGEKAYMNAFKQSLCPAGSASYSFVRKELHYQITLIYKCISQLTINYIYIDNNFTGPLTNAFMGRLGDVLNSKDDLSDSPLCKDLPRWLQLKLVHSLKVARSAIGDKAGQRIKEKNYPPLILIAMKSLTDDNLLEDIVKYVGYLLPDNCLNMNQIYHGLGNLKTPGLSSFWVFIIAVSAVAGVSGLVTVTYRYIPIEMFYSKVKGMVLSRFGGAKQLKMK